MKLESLNLQTAGSLATDPIGWGYTSGRISVLETLLLNRSFFESLIKAKSISEARAVLSKTQYRSVFAVDDSLYNYASSLEHYSEALMSDVLNYSPDHILKYYLNLKLRYMVFRNLFIRGSIRGATAEELESYFDGFVLLTDELDALESHHIMLIGRETVQLAGPVARSLYLDSANCTLALTHAGLIREELARRTLNDMSLLQSWSSILRSRWNGTSPDTIKRWFILPKEYKDFVVETGIFSDSQPVTSLGGRVSESTLNFLYELGTERIRDNIDRAVGESIREQIVQCRKVTYGPERILSFAVASGVEQENLRLSLAAVVHGIEPQVIVEMLRREYA
ncbi:MAG TPA: V-type ATPase subunit [Anaerolineae bacterium]|nr:V-type ATPase subunit [Anaerolineae bacterium]